MDVLNQHGRVPHFGGWASKSPYWPRFGGAFFLCQGPLSFCSCLRLRGDAHRVISIRLSGPKDLHPAKLTQDYGKLPFAPHSVPCRSMHPVGEGQTAILRRLFRKRQLSILNRRRVPSMNVFLRPKDLPAFLLLALGP